jgi:hypothetical protein
MTLNQVIASIKQYFKNHPLIEDVMVSLGDDDLNAVTGLKYPLVDIQYLDTDVVDKRFQHNLKIIIGDLTNPNVTGIDFEIYSDCLQIAGDFFQWLENNFDFDYIRNTNVQPFTDSNVDRVSGVVFNIGIYTWLNGDIDCIDVTPSTTTTTTTIYTPDNFCFQLTVDGNLMKQHTLQKGTIPAAFQSGYAPSDIRDYWEAMGVDGIVRLWWSDLHEWTFSINGENWFTSNEDVVSPDYVTTWQMAPIVPGGSTWTLSGSECALPNDMCLSLQVPGVQSWQATLSRGTIPADFQSGNDPEDIKMYWQGTSGTETFRIWWSSSNYWYISLLPSNEIYSSNADVLSPLSISNWVLSQYMPVGTTFSLVTGGC